MKAPDQPHFIQRFKFDFEIEKQEDASALHADLSRIFQQRLKRVVEQIMDELDMADHVIRIPQLVIDLGEIYEGSLEKEILMRFEHAFRHELGLRVRELRHPNAAIDADRGEKVSIVPARIEIVAYFIMNGRLPNGAEQMAGKVEQLFLELLETNPPAILRTLRSVARDPMSLKRLATAFSERLVLRLYSVIVTDNAISIASIEKKLIADIGKATKRPLSQVTMEVRRAIFRYLLVTSPTVFDRRKFQVAATQDVYKTFGLDPERGAASIEEQQAAFANQNEKRAKRAAAIEVLQRYLKGAAPAESPIAVAEAWEYLASQEAPALKKFLATKSVGIVAIRELVTLLSPAAMRDFVQKTVTSSPMQLIQVAASVTSAFATYGKGAATERLITAEVYAVLVQMIAVNPSVTPSTQMVAAAIRAHLAKLPEVPKELLKDWDELGLPGGAASPQTLKRQKAEREAAAESAQKAFDAKVAELKTRPKKGTQSSQNEDEATGHPEDPKATGAKKSKRGKTSKGPSDESGDLEARDVDLDDETFFKEARAQLSRRPDGIEIETLGSDVDEVIATPGIDTPEGRVELVLHMVTFGKRPWWAESVSNSQMEMFLKSAIAAKPEAVKAVFATWVRTLTSNQYPSVVAKLIDMVNEATLVNLMHVLAPEISGFMGTVALALGALLDAPAQSFSFPEHLNERHRFLWHYQVQYLLEYMSSTLTAGQLVRYVLKQTAAAIGMGPRPMIEQMAAIAEAEAAKGERRFNAFKTMVPKVFEGLQVNPPTPHAPIRDIWTRFEELESDVAAREEGTSAGLREKEEQFTEAERAFRERLASARDREVAVEKEREQKANEELDRRAKEKEAKEREAKEREAREKDARENESEERETREIEAKEREKEKEAKERESQGLPPIPADIGDGSNETEGTDPRLPGKERPADVPQGLEPQVEPLAGADTGGQDPKIDKQAERMPRIELRSPEEEEAEAMVVMEMIQHYLEHGTLSIAATRIFTPATFREMLLGMFAMRTPAVVAMLKTAMLKSTARLRVIAMSDEVALQVTALLQRTISDRLQPFVKEVLQLFTGGSAPLTRVHVLDHAMQYAIRTGGNSFVPLNYVRDLAMYVAALPGRDVKEVLTWANRRLDSSRSPLKEAMAEMLDVVERIEDSQNAAKRKKPLVSAPSAPVVIKAPDGDIYITNAGAGLIHIIFKQLFQAFKLLKDDNLGFVSLEAQTRAAHYIQYLTDKEVDAPEEKMVYNKLLVGLPIHQPLEPLAEPINQDEIDTCEYILEALCQKWTVMKSSGPDYVRKTFLMRDGRLRSNGDGWTIRVEQQGLDVLKNKIPWATNPVRLPWLTYLIDVDWP